jgi:hypothetical protein
MKRRHFLVLCIATAPFAALAGLALAAGTNSSQFAAAKQATAAFHDLNTAEAAGYGEFRDAAGIACIELAGAGGMGVHYVNGGLVGDALLDPTRPEALVYEPKPGGGVRLVALEYIVFKDVWEAAGHLQPPSLFGRQFDLTNSPNRYGIPPFYALHAWLWKPNASGDLEPWNARVDCA